MLKISYLCLAFGLLFSSVSATATQLNIGITTPHVNMAINVSSYPNLVVVPGYPVYYAPQLQANLFFYDGLYWMYDHDDWYASAWYNGPWDYVSAVVVPLYILRVPVRYYRLPPVYFRGWHQDAPPQWGRHWGHDWQQRRSGWDRWDRHANPQPAPRPVYQQQYSGERYPQQVEQQQVLRQQNYRYQAHDKDARQYDSARVGAHVSEAGNGGNTAAVRSQRQLTDVRVEPGSARANGGRQWDMPRDRQSSAPQPADMRSEPRPLSDAGTNRRYSPRPERAAGRSDRPSRATEPPQPSRADEPQSTQQDRDGNGNSRLGQDSARGRSRND